jgi:ubiquinone/menaquinone biosynthesis C-methylase UbiE
MAGSPEFRSDLYQGTARFYDECRVPYPQPLLDELCRRAGTTGVGRLLDLACGTGQITFRLASNFAEVWAVDQERETVEFASEKAAGNGIRNVAWITGRAEDVDADAFFELVGIGNAFHRLQRQVVAASAMRWLAPGGHLALLWSGVPWVGGQAWQETLAEAVDQWTREAGVGDRIPADLAEHLSAEPHTTVLARAGFTIAGEFEVESAHQWTVESLTGYAYSTAILSPAALGRHTPAFERDVRERLLAVEPDGVFRESISFKCTLARRP